MKEESRPIEDEEEEKEAPGVDSLCLPKHRWPKEWHVRGLIDPLAPLLVAQLGVPSDVRFAGWAVGCFVGSVSMAVGWTV